MLQENTESLLERQSYKQKCQEKKVERRCTIMDLIKQRKLKLFGHICKRKISDWLKTVMLGMVGIDFVEDHLEDGLTTLQTGVDVHSRRLYYWRVTDMSGANHWPQRPTWVVSSGEYFVSPRTSFCLLCSLCTQCFVSLFFGCQYQCNGTAGKTRF